MMTISETSTPTSSQPTHPHRNHHPPPHFHNSHRGCNNSSSASHLIRFNPTVRGSISTDHVVAAPPVFDSQTLAPHAGLELNLSSSMPNSLDESKVGIAKNFDEENFRFDLEEETMDDFNGDVGLGPVIPGLSTGDGGDLGSDDAGRDDWDSDDSEYDLQIVLNEPNGLENGR